MRSRDVRALMRLFSECREIVAAGGEAALHFLAGLGRITRAVVSPLVTLARSDVADLDWHMSEARNDVHRPASIDDSLLSMARLGEGKTSFIALKRAWGEAPFGDEERELLDVAHGECGWIFETPSTRAPLDVHFSKRERETLDLLLTGMSEKEVAASLELSPHTVHDYVKVIFRKLRVASRAELMARALTPRIALRGSRLA
jgi:DNA-binding CsgD family transcriptional regulator